MELRVIPRPLTVCKVGAVSDIDFTKDFYFVGRTADEISLVAATADVPADVVAREDGWLGFYVTDPGNAGGKPDGVLREESLVDPSGNPGGKTAAESENAEKTIGELDFSLVGILANLSGVLAEKGIPIFAVSTYNTDYILVKEERFAEAVRALQAAGHRFSPYVFYGWEEATVGVCEIIDQTEVLKDEEGACEPETTRGNRAVYSEIETPMMLYDTLSEIWCAETCAPRMREDWTPENKTLGQCSITAFLVQDIFGGKVYGILRPGGNYHCYNVIDGHTFDLTSEQFGDEVLDYTDNPEQFREVHFAKEEKRLRYEYLKEELMKYCAVKRRNNKNEISQ